MKNILGIFLHGIHGTAIWAIIASSIVALIEGGHFVANPLFTFIFTIVGVGVFLNSQHQIRWWSLITWAVGYLFVLLNVISLISIAVTYLLIMTIGVIAYFMPPKF
jgi:hypothetical protein